VRGATGTLKGVTTPEVPQVGAEEAARLVRDGAFLLDVREPDEWLAGHAAAATHIPLGLIPDRTAELPVDTTIVAVCRVGGRSQQAAAFLVAKGIEAVNLAGGMKAWAAAGLDVITDDGDPGRVI
jgi:rhodanese-related sulfurtransferase